VTKWVLDTTVSEQEQQEGFCCDLQPIVDISASKKNTLIFLQCNAIGRRNCGVQKETVSIS
jgi:hypothetical protein